jgi:hypothetical protein
MTHRSFHPASIAPAQACARAFGWTMRGGDSLSMPRHVVATHSLA